MPSKLIQKGQVLNPTGRPKGAVGKKTKAVQESIQWVMEHLESTLIADLDRVRPERRLQLYTDLMQYVKPKLSTTKADIDIQSDNRIEIVIINDNALPPAQADNVINID